MEGLDPKIQAIMAKMNAPEGGPAGDQPEKPKEDKKPPKPPLTYEEFIQAEKILEWPIRITSENVLDLSEERELLGSPHDIANQIKEATPVDMKMLRELEDRLERFDRTLASFADSILASSDDGAQRDKGCLPLSINRAFLTDIAESDAVKTHPSRKHKAKTARDELSRQQTVERCAFPGFRRGELTELPAGLEAPQLLHRVTHAQDFNSGFRKFWKKIFQSEASVAMIQDSFWWIFIELFQKDKKSVLADHGRLFDRMADSFVALFNSVNPEIKDKVFTVYADCLAQALYAGFWEAFPESERYFQDTFKQFLCNITSEWVSGIKCTPGSWSKWPLKRLESRGHRSSDHTKPSPAHQIHKDAGPGSLGTDEFLRMVERLGNRSALSRLGGDQRDATQLTLDTAAVTRAGTHVTAATKAATRSKHESSVMGPGPEMERNVFNLNGRSPLVAHYLHMRQLQPISDRGMKVRRTEVLKLPPSDLPTYQDLIDQTLLTSRTLSNEYQKVCDMTQQEILRIEKTQRDTNRKIEKLQKELLFCKNNLEVKVMSERLLGKQEAANTPRVMLNEVEEDEELPDSF